MEIQISVQSKREIVEKLKKSGKPQKALRLQKLISHKEKLATQARILIQSQKKKMLKLNGKIRKTKKMIKVACKANKIVIQKTTLTKLISKKKTPSVLKSILTLGKPKKIKTKLATKRLKLSFKKSISKQSEKLSGKKILRDEI